MTTFKKRFLLPFVLLCTQQAHSSTWFDWFDHDLENIFMTQEEELKRIDHQLMRLEKQKQSLTEERKKLEHKIKRSQTDQKSNSFTCEEKRSEKDGVKQFNVMVNLPGFQEQDLTISTQSKNNQLHITGTKTTKTQPHAHGYVSEEFVSSQNINGKKRKLKYKDGSIDLVLDLPEDIKSKDFDTTFENGMLTVTFQVK